VKAIFLTALGKVAMANAKKVRRNQQTPRARGSKQVSIRKKPGKRVVSFHKDAPASNRAKSKAARLVKPISAKSQSSIHDFSPRGGDRSVLAGTDIEIITLGESYNASDWIEWGATTNFIVFASAELGTIGAELATAVLNDCEADLAKISAIFGINAKGVPFRVYIQSGAGGAYHSSCSSTKIYCYSGSAQDLEYVPFLLVAEFDEVLMANRNNGWNCGASNGEALSRYLANYAHPTQNIPTAACWLNTIRLDFVNTTEPTDQNYVSIGCGVLFLNYLVVQRQFPINAVVWAGGSTFQKTYATLTGSADALGPFTWLLQKRFPLGVRALLLNDNPFPLPDPFASLNLTVRATIQNRGVVTALLPLRFVGTRDQNQRLEQFSLSFSPANPRLSFLYMAHLQNGDTATAGDPSTWTAEGNTVGTNGVAMEGFAIRLAGADAPMYTVSYMAHIRGVGDTDWVSDGAYCGARNQSHPVEGLSVCVVPKTIDVTVQLQGMGDRLFYGDQFAGTRGQSRRLEEFVIRFDPPMPNLSLAYMAYIHNSGDTGDPADPSTWTPEGGRVGTPGQQIEGFAIVLTGTDAAKYEISYMAHIQRVGDTQWFWHGDFCGTRSESLRVEGMRIRINAVDFGKLD
jgi:uncharacterized protein YjdB